MASVRYIIKDRLERAKNNTIKSQEYLKEVYTIFNTYGDKYEKYKELILSIIEMIDTAEHFIEKLNDSV